jgi:predicted acyl esterase
LRSDNLYFDYQFDEDTAILGAIQVSLRVKTSRNDTDFVVRVSDVYPGKSNSLSMLLSDNVVRMRWRSSIVKTVPTVPGVEYVITLDMWTLCYVFNAGHTMRIAITSSNYPRYRYKKVLSHSVFLFDILIESINLNNGNLVWQGGPALNATNTIVLGTDSFVVLPTIGLDQLPRINIF